MRIILESEEETIIPTEIVHICDLIKIMYRNRLPPDIKIEKDKGLVSD